ncbi:flavodoxin [Photobacterium swingsii]|uniref:Flavodoxin n=1 Tax=Photobacterium swingsii TaxID=680026 RepID=A0A0J8VA46_9GAMM|nr:flavodoxin [Photobacterium swingsii]KMV29495.1 flavodoxin [Photobacterium swingsii]PSW20940.1 flavodoxin [Photobacterium swingsii]
MAKIGVFVGSVFGGAEDVAEEVAAKLNESGHLTQVYLDPELSDFVAYQQDMVLVISSTTGQGEIPDNLLPLFMALSDQFPLMPAMHYGVVALGDSSYGEDRYCGGGRQFDELLQQLQAKPLAPRLDVDACVNFDALEVVIPWLGGLLKKVA